MDSKTYLSRIGVNNCGEVSLSMLATLVRAHLHSVPFENTDIYYKLRFVQLSLPWMYNKVVVNGRGGYCYELDGLFAWLLRQLGYTVTMVSARVCRQSGLATDFDHMALLVTIDGLDWLVDVGFGNFASTPLPVQNNVTHVDDKGIYNTSLTSYNGQLYWQVARHNQLRNEWTPEYLFTTMPQQLQNFADRNYFQQTSPDSHFIKNFFCSMLTNEGRISIVNNFLVKNSSTGKLVTAISDIHEKELLLVNLFNLNIQLGKSQYANIQGR